MSTTSPRDTYVADIARILRSLRSPQEAFKGIRIPYRPQKEAVQWASAARTLYFRLYDHTNRGEYVDAELEARTALGCLDKALADGDDLSAGAQAALPRLRGELKAAVKGLAEAAETRDAAEQKRQQAARANFAIDRGRRERFREAADIRSIVQDLADHYEIPERINLASPDYQVKSALEDIVSEARSASAATVVDRLGAAVAGYTDGSQTKVWVGLMEAERLLREGK